MKMNLWVVLIAGWIWFAVPASALYVDANGANTELADGSGDPWLSTRDITLDNLWYDRPNYGNNASGLIASGNNIIEAKSEVYAQLVTTANGLIPNAWYRADAVYWSKSGVDNWNVTAGFTLGSRTIYSFTGGDILGLSTVEGVQTGKIQGLIYEMLGEVGYKQADGNGEIKVYIDDLADGTDDTKRTWYDGLLITPLEPTALSAAGADSVVELAWTQSFSSSIVSNRIYRTTVGSSGPWSLVASLEATTTYSDNLVSNGQVYYYVVTAVSAIGESAYSTPASARPWTTPAAPTELSAIGTHSVVTLSWTQSASSGVLSNRIWRSTNGDGSYSLLTSLPATTTYIDSGVTAGLTYYYVVTAVAISGESADSTSAFTVPQAPGAVPVVSGANPTAGSEVGSLSLVTVTFSDPVLGVDASDLLIDGQPATSLVGNSGTNVYSFLFTQPDSGTVNLTWSTSHGIVELGGTSFNAIATGSTWSYTLVDTIPPHIAETMPFQGTTVSALTQVEILFTESVLGISASDFLLNGQHAASMTGSGDGPYIFQFAQPSDGVVQISWATGHGITDTAANAYEADVWSYTLDPTYGQSLRINEFLAGNGGGLRDEDEESPDWIEIYNAGISAIDLDGWHLTDSEGDLTKWTFPSTSLASGGYLVVFASGKNRATSGSPLHTTFQLSDGGGYLALIRPDGTVAHGYVPEYPNQRANVSFGLEGSEELRYFSIPTPGVANGTGSLGLVADTKFSVDRGFYNAPFAVEITCATPGAAIYWTIDGTAPTLSNGTLYTGPVPVSGITLLRAAAFLSNHIPSVSDTQTYLFLDEVLQQSAAPAGYPMIWQAGYPADYEMDPNVVNSSNYGATIADDLRSIPSLSIVSSHEDFWDPSTGIYVDATQEGPFWERAVSAELFNGDGTSEFQVNCGVQMQGNASRDNGRLAKHSFRLLFKGEYGPSKLGYDWFDGPVKEFNTIVLRACFTDSWATRSQSGRYIPHDSLYLRDVWVKEAMLDMGNLAGHGSFVHLYVNGLYWGLYNPAERLDASYFADYVGGYEKDWDVMRDWNALLEGSRTDWDNLQALVNAGISDEADYQAVADLVDIDNLIDYFILHFLGEAEDWPSHNWYAAHRRANATTGLPATKWIFLPWDQEIVLDPKNSRDKTTVSNDGTPARIYSQLRSWPEFQVRFGDRVQKHLFNGGALTPLNNTVRLQELAARIDRAIVGESARWGDAREFTIGGNPGHGQTFTRDEWWVPSVEAVTTSLLPNVINPLTISRLKTRNLYPSTATPVFSQFGGAVPSGFGLVITNPGASGTIYYTLDGTDPRVCGTGSVAPTAVGYSGSVVITAPTQVRARVLGSTGKWSARVEASFYPPQDLSQLALTEIMYHPLDLGSIDGGQLEFLELKNMGTTPLDLSGLTFSSGITFTFPNGTIMAPGQFFVLARDEAAFASKYPGVAVQGIYTGKLNNGGEKLTLSHALGTSIFSVTYNDRSPWPSTPDLADFSLVQRQPGVSQAPDSGSSWRASVYAGGSPGTDDPEPTIAPVVVNEILAHTDLPQKDSIELYNPASTNVDVGGWYLSDDAGIPKKFRIPDDTIIPPNGYIYFDEDDFNPAPGVGASFSFSSVGDDAYLYSATAGGILTGYDHGMKFGASFNGESFGRHVNSVGEVFYPRQVSLTLGASNAGPEIGPVVISEIHYHPNVMGDEFIALANITSSPVPLFSEAYPTNTWKIRGLDYTFPSDITLPANGALLVVGVDPALFRAKYGIPAGVPVLGPYAGELQDSGENLELQEPDNPNVDGIPYVTVDAVRYNDKLPWPPAADGGGLALRRLALADYGNDPANWAGAVPISSGMPIIISHPRSVAAYTGETVTFQVSSAGYEPLVYQWFSNDVALTGQTSSNLVLAELQPGQAANYQVLVTNTLGTAFSDAAELVVADWPEGGLEWMGDEGVYLSYPVLPGRLYQVEYRTNLVVGDWLPFGSSVFAVSNTIEVGNVVTNDLHRFFRLRSSP